MDAFVLKAIKAKLAPQGIIRINIENDRSGIIQFDDEAYVLYRHKGNILTTRVGFGNVIEAMPAEKIIEHIKYSIQRSKEKIDELEMDYKEGELATLQGIIKMQSFVKDQLKYASALLNRGFYEEKFTRKRYDQIAKLIKVENLSPNQLIEKFRIEFGLADKLLLDESKEG